MSNIIRNRVHFVVKFDCVFLKPCNHQSILFEILREINLMSNIIRNRVHFVVKLDHVFYEHCIVT